jgi:hypothetical protein
MNKSITQATQNDKQISKSIKRFFTRCYCSLVPRSSNGFCRCFAFQIGKICYHHCIIRHFQFRKCLPVNSNKTIKKKSHRYMSCGILCLCEFIIVLGQLNAYVGYYKKNEMIEGDNPPVGILLCTDKGSQMVEYALSGMDNQLFVSTYMLHLPDKKKLEEFMLKEIEEMEM